MEGSHNNYAERKKPDQKKNPEHFLNVMSSNPPKKKMSAVEPVICNSFHVLSESLHADDLFD